MVSLYSIFLASCLKWPTKYCLKWRFCLASHLLLQNTLHFNNTVGLAQAALKTEWRFCKQPNWMFPHRRKGFLDVIHNWYCQSTLQILCHFWWSVTLCGCPKLLYFQYYLVEQVLKQASHPTLELRLPLDTQNLIVNQPWKSGTCQPVHLVTNRTRNTCHSISLHIWVSCVKFIEILRSLSGLRVSTHFLINLPQVCPKKLDQIFD